MIFSQLPALAADLTFSYPGARAEVPDALNGICIPEGKPA